MPQTAAGRYTTDFRTQRYGSPLKAVHQRSGQTVAEGVARLGRPVLPARVPAHHPRSRAAAPRRQVSGGHDQAPPAQVWDPGKEKVSYTQDLWPYVLLGVLALFLLDLHAKRVRLFGYRTIKFQ